MFVLRGLNGQMVSRGGQDDAEALADFLTIELGRLLENPPVSEHREGLEHTRRFFGQRLQKLGFEIDHVYAAVGEPVLVATRRRGRHWVGFSGHYDIEHAGDGWTFPPFVVTKHRGRLYARGIADNLGPLLLRLAAFEQVDGGPSIVVVLQGEEEVGSPAAHEVYPALGSTLPSVVLWFEETGYFEFSGVQRVLSRRPSALSQGVLDVICQVASRYGRTVEIHDRYLNKAFGNHRCPFLTHLVGDSPYIAIGPNDPYSRIHQSDESLAIDHLSIAVEQIVMLLNTLGENP